MAIEMPVRGVDPEPSPAVSLSEAARLTGKTEAELQSLVWRGQLTASLPAGGRSGLTFRPEDLSRAGLLNPGVPSPSPTRPTPRPVGPAPSPRTPRAQAQPVVTSAPRVHRVRANPFRTRSLLAAFLVVSAVGFLSLVVASTQTFG